MSNLDANTMLLVSPARVIGRFAAELQRKVNTSMDESNTLNVALQFVIKFKIRMTSQTHLFADLNWLLRCVLVLAFSLPRRFWIFDSGFSKFVQFWCKVKRNTLVYTVAARSKDAVVVTTEGGEQFFAVDFSALLG